MKFDHKITASFQLHESEREKLKQMAKENECGMSEILRQLIERAWEEREKKA